MTSRLHAVRSYRRSLLLIWSLPQVECGAEPVGVHRPGVVVVAGQGVEEPDQVATPGGVSSGLAGCVPGQGRDGLIEPAPLVVADELLERGGSHGRVEPTRGVLVGGFG